MDYTIPLLVPLGQCMCVAVSLASLSHSLPHIARMRMRLLRLGLLLVANLGQSIAATRSIHAWQS
jgi:hypothetical protein